MSFGIALRGPREVGWLPWALLIGLFVLFSYAWQYANGMPGLSTAFAAIALGWLLTMLVGIIAGAIVRTYLPNAES